VAVSELSVSLLLLGRETGCQGNIARRVHIPAEQVAASRIRPKLGELRDPWDLMQLLMLVSWWWGFGRCDREGH
jgi:hypothetical protein